jgi:hypothetical protein
LLPLQGGSDILATKADSDLLVRSLPQRAIKSYSLLSNYEHLDFIWAMDAKERLYLPVVQQLLEDVEAQRMRRR